MLLFPALEEFVSDVPSSHLSSRGSYPLDISDLGDPPGSNTTAGLVPGFLELTQTSPPRQDGGTIGEVFNV